MRIFKRTGLEAIKTGVRAKKVKRVYGEMATGKKKSDIRVVEHIKGNYNKFWKDLSGSDSRIFSALPSASCS